MKRDWEHQWKRLKRWNHHWAIPRWSARCFDGRDHHHNIKERIEDKNPLTDSTLANLNT
jgi:hypothetical protein